jgi:hypothetical protein
MGKKEKNDDDGVGTFACFDFARFDFFLLMIVLNQSPEPMASTGVHRRDQFVFRSAELQRKAVA